MAIAPQNAKARARRFSARRFSPRRFSARRFAAQRFSARHFSSASQDTTSTLRHASSHVAQPVPGRHKNRKGSDFNSLTTVSTSARELRSEEHTSELQSRENLVCRLLLEKKKTKL